MARENIGKKNSSQGKQGSEEERIIFRDTKTKYFQEHTPEIYFSN